MIILFKNNKIIGIEDIFLKKLNIDFNKLSNIISELELLISSKQKKILNIKNYFFEIEEINLISLENIKIFKLKEVIENQISLNNSVESNKLESKIDNSTEKIPFEEELLITSNQTQTNPKNNNLKYENSLEKNLSLSKEKISSFEKNQSILNLENQNLNLENSTKENTLFKNNSSLMDLNPLLNPKISYSTSIETNVDLFEIHKQQKKETTNIKSQNSIKKNLSNSQKSTFSSFEINQPSINLEKNINFSLEENLLKTPLSKESKRKIIISFEDDFDEIQKILSLEEKKAKKLIAKDLEKASKDLGIDIQTINNLYKNLIKQIKNKKKSFYKAIENKNYEDIHKIAHTLKGAALNLRLSNLAIILKKIDEESKKHKTIEDIKFLIDKFYEFINKIETEIPQNIKNLILITIKNYLTTQDEKKFKKDLKYIEKLLNTKISSLKELEELIKE